MLQLWSAREKHRPQVPGLLCGIQEACDAFPAGYGVVEILFLFLPRPPQGYSEARVDVSCAWASSSRSGLAVLQGGTSKGTKDSEESARVGPPAEAEASWDSGRTTSCTVGL